MLIISTHTGMKSVRGKRNTTGRSLLQLLEYLAQDRSFGFPKMISLRSVLAGVGFQDPQHFCDRLGVLMCTVARRDDVFALRAVHV
jgi:hypothetical protein